MAEMSPGAADLFERTGMSGRAAHSSRLWIDDNGRRLPIRYTYSGPSFYGLDKYNAVFKFWSENSCLTFKKEELSRCSTEQSAPTLWLQSQRFQTENFGIDKSQACTNMSLKFATTEYAHRHMMNALGLLPYIYREDAAEHISRNDEHLGCYDNMQDVRFLKSMVGRYHRCHGTTPMLPTPFDYMSWQTPTSNLKNSADALPVYVTRDPSLQYLLDYHGYLEGKPTYYDVLVINTLYKCPAEWAAACSGTVPTCRNHGYLLRTCECRCPPGFSGDTCQIKTGPLFPLQRAAYEVNVTADQTYDFSSLNVQTIDTANKYARIRNLVFIFIRIAPKKANYLPSISLFLPFKDVQKKIGPHQQWLIENLATGDCTFGHRLFWGSGRRLACECVSSLVNNEPASEVRVFRARKPGMSMTLINHFTSVFVKQAGITELTSRYRLTAEFRPPLEFSVAEKKGDQPTPVITGGGDVVINGSSTGAMKSPVSSVISLSLVVGPPLLLLLLCCLLLHCCRRRSANKKQVAEPRVEEHEGSGSNSEGTGDSEDSAHSEGGED